jgi:hypothetical protein
MKDKQTLAGIVSENWDAITKNLGLNFENNPSKYTFALLSHLRPLLDSAAETFRHPSSAVYVSVEDKNKNNILLLEKMGFVNRYYDSNSYGLTSKGVELVDCYLRQKNPNLKTHEALERAFLKLSDHLF